MKDIRLIWECNLCKDVVISYSFLRHDMNFCECGKTGVDLEEHYQRSQGEPNVISRKSKEKDGSWKNLS